MERLRFVADNRTARRRLVSEKMASMDAEVFPLIAGAFAGRETIPDQLLDTGLLERIRAA